MTMDATGQRIRKPRDVGSQIKFNWKLLPILPNEFIELSTLEKSFIGILKNKKNTSKVINNLANILPMPQHLKRCSGLEIYLTSFTKMNGKQEVLKKFLIQKGFDIAMFEDDFKIAYIPSIVPKTKTQMVYASSFWPINFHPNVYIESVISGSIFNNLQLASLEAYMKLAISIAEKRAVGSKYCNGSALIINPENGSILSMATSSLDKHPMWHASMLAIDLVAKLQGGGTWKIINHVKIALEFTKMKYSNVMPLCYPEFTVTAGIYKTMNSILISKDIKMNKNNKTKMNNKSGSYLCTGYWAILLQEPCPLCAMALLHSRISSIFYGVSNVQTGILGSRAILHSVPGLNHRYQVWSSILRTECMKTLEKCQWVDN